MCNLALSRAQAQRCKETSDFIVQDRLLSSNEAIGLKSSH